MAPLFVKEGLQDERGGDLVDNSAVGLAGVTGFVEHLMGFVGGESLIPGVNRELRELSQFRGEGLDLNGLGGDLAIRAERVPYDNSCHLVPAAEAGQGAEVFARIPATVKSEDGLSREAQFVGDCYADAL